MRDRAAKNTDPVSTATSSRELDSVDWTQPMFEPRFGGVRNDNAHWTLHYYFPRPLQASGIERRL